MSYARQAKASDIGYKKGRLSTTVPALPVTDAYRAGAERLGWTFEQKFCATCGRLPSWCECKQAEQQETHG